MLLDTGLGNDYLDLTTKAKARNITLLLIASFVPLWSSFAFFLIAKKKKKCYTLSFFSLSFVNLLEIFLCGYHKGYIKHLIVRTVYCEAITTYLQSYTKTLHLLLLSCFMPLMSHFSLYSNPLTSYCSYNSFYNYCLLTFIPKVKSTITTVLFWIWLHIYFSF